MLNIPPHIHPYSASTGSSMAPSERPAVLLPVPVVTVGARVITDGADVTGAARDDHHQ